jgi:hypothetical protein
MSSYKFLNQAVSHERKLLVKVFNFSLRLIKYLYAGSIGKIESMAYISRKTLP